MSDLDKWLRQCGACDAGLPVSCVCPSDDPRPVILDLAQRAEAAEATHRDLVSRLGFGNNITEPMADNDTVVAWFEEQGREAAEWRESQLWRDECYAAGHPDDEDCHEHDPARRLEAAEAALERVRDVLHAWETASSRFPTIRRLDEQLRAALDPKEDQ